MPRYHVSSDGEPRVCEAAKGKCPLKGEDGNSLPHGQFDSPADARIFAEAMNSAQFGGSFPTVGGKLDQTSVEPCYSTTEHPDLYPAAQPANENTVRNFYSSFYSFYEEKGWELEMEEYGDDYQEFKDSSGDHDGVSLELTATRETFNDAGKLESSSVDHSRVVFEDEAERQEASQAVMSAEDLAELEADGKFIREEWVSPNTRVTYWMDNY